MTPQIGHIYRLNTGHTAICTYVGAVTAMFRLPVTGALIAFRIDSADADHIGIASEIAEPNLPAWLELWTRGLVVEWIGSHLITGVSRDAKGLITGTRTGPTRTDAMLRLLVLARN